MQLLSNKYEPLKQYGIIGFPLSHSFSPGYFTQKFLELGIHARYDTFPLTSIEDFKTLLEKRDLVGVNVTIPYKEEIIPFLDEIDEEASIVGAVNTIHFKDGKSKGYNTDVYGFETSLVQFIKNPSNIKSALILGSGGAAKAVAYVLKKLQISYNIVSRSDRDHLLTYEKLDGSIFKDYNLIINTTPLGMYPNTEVLPQIPYDLVTHDYYFFDLVYNPELSSFLKKGKEKLAKTQNGLHMLMLQAEKAWEIWNN